MALQAALIFQAQGKFVQKFLSRILMAPLTRCMADDKFDLIALGQPFIANSDYVAKYEIMITC